MYKIIQVLKTKNKDVEIFENMESVKQFLVNRFGNYTLTRPYYGTNLQVEQLKENKDFRIIETYKGILVTPSDDLFIYLTQ